MQIELLIIEKNNKKGAIHLLLANEFVSLGNIIGAVGLVRHLLDRQHV